MHTPKRGPTKEVWLKHNYTANVPYFLGILVDLLGVFYFLGIYVEFLVVPYFLEVLLNVSVVPYYLGILANFLNVMR